jgi:hypothetical protein
MLEQVDRKQICRRKTAVMEKEVGYLGDERPRHPRPPIIGARPQRAHWMEMELGRGQQTQLIKQPLRQCTVAEKGSLSAWAGLLDSSKRVITVDDVCSLLCPK